MIFTNDNKSKKLYNEIFTLNYLIKKIENEVRSDLLNRTECKFLLNKLFTNLFSIKKIFNEILINSDDEKKQLLEKELIYTLEIYVDVHKQELTWGKKTIMDLFETIVYEIKFISQKTEKKSDKDENFFYYNEENLRNDIYEYLNILKLFVDRINSQILKPMKKDIFDTLSIKQFLEDNLLTLNENWVIAVCYLSMIDIIVNKKGEEFAIFKTEKEKRTKSFHDKLDDLIKEIKERGKEVNEGMIGFQNILRDLRTRIVHFGVNPSRKELDFIIEYSNKTINELNKLKP